MSQWRITRGDEQFVAKDLAELKIWAANGKVRPDDLIQAPGDTEWAYAAQTPELDGLLKQHSGDGPTEEDFHRQKSEKTLRQIVLVVTGIGVIIAFAVMIRVLMDPPDPADKDLRTGTFAVKARDALITNDCALRRSPDARSAAVTNLSKDDRVQLLSKHGDFYEVATEANQQGYVIIDDILPGYYLAKDDHEKWDPIYNPEIYLSVSMSNWQVVMDEYKPRDVEHLTLLSLNVANTSQYDMDGIVFLVHFWDPVNEIRAEEVTLEEVVPANGSLYHELEFEVNIEEVPRATLDVIGARVIDQPIR